MISIKVLKLISASYALSFKVCFHLLLLVANMTNGLTMPLYPGDADTNHELSKRPPLNPLCPVITPKFIPLKLVLGTGGIVVQASLPPGPERYIPLAVATGGKKVLKKAGKTFCALG